MYFAYGAPGHRLTLLCTPPPRAAAPSAGRPPAKQGVTRRRATLALVSMALLLPGAAERAPVGRATGLAVTGMTFVQSQGETAAMVVEAERGRLDPESQVVHLEAVQTRVEGTAERSGFELTCDEGELVLDTHALLASGNVRGRTADGRSFSTSWVRYDPKRDLAYTDAPVEILEASGSLRGGGFRYYVREGRFRLLGGATVRREN